MPIRHVLRAFLVTIAVALGAPFSAYGQVLAVATVEGTFTLRVNSTTWQPVPMGFQITAVEFTTTTDNERIVITYTATCLAGGFTLNVRANVDGVIASPGVANGVSLCLVPGTGGSSFPASRTFSVVVPTKGPHKVTIEVRGPGAAVLLGESALVIQR